MDPDAPYANFASSLRGEMAYKGMGVEELALVCGVTRQTVSSWRAGKTLPTLTSFVYIHSQFDLDQGRMLAAIAQDLMQQSDQQQGALQRHLDTLGADEDRDDAMAAFEANRERLIRQERLLNKIVDSYHR